MKLADLEAKLLVRASTRTPGAVRFDPGPSLEHAQGVMFLCPKCFAANGGRVGTHPVIAWFAGRGVPDDAVPGPARWTVSGTGIADLTLAPSVQLVGGCGWHGWVRNGDAA